MTTRARYLSSGSSKKMPRRILGELGNTLATAPARHAVKQAQKNVVALECEKAERVRRVAVRRLRPSPAPSLPAGVLDVDARDAGLPALCSEYARETFVYLRGLEISDPLPQDFLAGSPITQQMRAVLVNWLVEVSTQFTLLQETIFLAVQYLDRYLAVKGRTVFKSQLQLVGVAALFLAAKMEEVFAPSIKDFVYITDHTYTEAEVKTMELQLLRTLNFDMTRPVALTFLRRCSKAGQVNQRDHTVAKFVLETGLLDYSLASLPASLLAASALAMALQTRPDPPSPVWSLTLQYHSGYSEPAVRGVATRLAALVNTVTTPGYRHQATRSRYQTASLHSVVDSLVRGRDRLVRISRGC